MGKKTRYPDCARHHKQRGTVAEAEKNKTETKSAADEARVTAKDDKGGTTIKKKKKREKGTHLKD